MIAVDTNLLVYAHREDSEFHSVAAQKLEELAQGKATWGLHWPCVHEFFSIRDFGRFPALTVVNPLAK